MKQLAVLDYLKLNKWQKFVYKLKCFFCAIPGWFVGLFKTIGRFFVKFGVGIWNNLKDIGNTFVKGSWKTKVSFFIMGFGNICFGQPLRGLLFFLFEAVFITYMCLPHGGAFWLSKFDDLGDVAPTFDKVWDDRLGEYVEVPVPGDDSFKILLYGLMTIVFMVALIYTWRLNVKQCRINEEILASGKKVKSTKDDLKSLLDDQFHKTLLALPLLGIMVFTVIPIIFMILVAFTNYSSQNDGYSNLFTWVGLENFNQLVNFSNGTNSFSLAFGEILTWTLIWAVFATFTNYFFGIFVAMMINKKGIRFKKWWRTALVMTIAVPQFISLMYVSKMFSNSGIINGTLIQWGWIDKPIGWWTDTANKGLLSRVMVIVINIWIGIPYLMLIATGILMNIPADLYESAKIDGASGAKQFTKITLPYMLFVTGPYLLTNFTGNLNNFNVIFLLTGGTPTNSAASGAGGSVGYTDLLITWLFKLTTVDSKYYLASIIGIMIFIVVSIISLIVYNVMPSNKNEGDFS